MATLYWWSDGDVCRFFMNHLAWYGEPWRLLTSALLHVEPFHLLFNLYWLWVFGTVVERNLGPLKTLGVFVFLAAGSSAAEYAFAHGGVGLSGVGYGLFGFLWLAGRRDPRFREAVDQSTVLLFVGWFALCVALTAANIWNVGNIAHAAGAGLGSVLGLAASGRSQSRLGNAGLLGLAIGLLFLAASIGRPYVNVLGVKGQGLAVVGYEALTEEENERAAEFYRRAVETNSDQSSWWFNLGIAYDRLDRDDEAVDAYHRAYRLEPHNAKFRDVLRKIKAWVGRKAFQEGRYEDAIRHSLEVLEIDDSSAEVWYILGDSYKAMGRHDEAVAAYTKAASRPRDNEE